MVRAHPVPVDAAMLALLPGTGVSDAYRLTVEDDAIDARTAATRVFASTPTWVGRLMAVRNALVAPLGLKTGISQRSASRDRIGFFPVIAETPERLLLGLDDKHLDFGIAVDVTPIGSRLWQITATTLVRPHNLLGRAYLAVVLPFHRMIVPTMLNKAAAP